MSLIFRHDDWSKVPRAIDPTTTNSEFFPGQLQLLTIDRQAVPQLSRPQHRRLLSLSVDAWRLYRARQRVKRDEELSERLRNRILQSFAGPFRGLYGFRVFRKRRLEVKVTEQHSDKVAHPPGFIEYLGKHASEVVTGFTLPIEQIMSIPAGYDKMVVAVASVFGEELAAQVGITFNRDRLHKLITEGELGEIPEGVLERVVGSRQVRVKLLEKGD